MIIGLSVPLRFRIDGRAPRSSRELITLCQEISRNILLGAKCITFQKCVAYKRGRETVVECDLAINEAILRRAGEILPEEADSSQPKITPRHFLAIRKAGLSIVKVSWEFERGCPLSCEGCSMEQDEMPSSGYLWFMFTFHEKLGILAGSLTLAFDFRREDLNAVDVFKRCFSNFIDFFSKFIIFTYIH